MFEIKLLSDYLKKLNPSFAASDFVDKAHFALTCGLMILFATIIGSKQIWGEPINCFVPHEIPGTWAQYIKGYCYVTGTYNIKSDGDIMAWDEDYVAADEKTNVAYYQWVPYMLVLQAALFFLPHLFWRLFQKSQTDICFEQVVEKCVAGRDMIVDKKNAEINDITDDLMKTHDFRQVKCKTTGLGSAGFIAYLFSKLLNISNVVFQIYLLNWFVGRQSLTWGIEAIKNGVQLFPRVSMCLFKQNVLAGIQNHTVQCLLMTNVINEKVFILLYVWFVVLLVVSALNILYFLYNYVYRRSENVDRYLQGKKGSLRSDNFTSWNLGFDGVLLLHFVENSAGFVMASNLAQALYNSLEKEAAVDNGGLGCSNINVDKIEHNRFRPVKRTPIPRLPFAKEPSDISQSLIVLKPAEIPETLGEVEAIDISQSPKEVSSLLNFSSA